ncbi:MAG: PilZ domain-containing protein [Candidatus Omnitrophota bacterium]
MPSLKHKIKVRNGEKRKSQRLNIPLNIKFKGMWGEKSLQEITTKDVSGGGMRITSERLLDKGSKIKAQLNFPHQPKPVHLISEVVWCKKKKMRKKIYYEAGIKHIRVAPCDRQRFVFLFCETMLNYLILQ